MGVGGSLLVFSGTLSMFLFLLAAPPWRVQAKALWGSYYSINHMLFRSILKLASMFLILHHPPTCPPRCPQYKGPAFQASSHKHEALRVTESKSQWPGDISIHVYIAHVPIKSELFMFLSSSCDCVRSFQTSFFQ